MSATDLQRIADFRVSFAQRQAAVLTGVPGGVAVLDPEYPASHEHNQVIIGQATAPDGLPALADKALGHLPHRRITILDDASGAASAAALTAAGYTHETELIMTHSGAAVIPGPAADEVTYPELRPALVRQWRAWMPEAGDTVIGQLADRRPARLRGADQVIFLAARDEKGTIASWADLYLDPARDIAQIEDLVTAETHLRRGYADAVLATALRHAAGYGLFFLLADAGDWPHTWYARRGFTLIGRSHAFNRAEGDA
jgi:GNAT superfamily N-acetyltransferase